MRQLALCTVLTPALLAAAVAEDSGISDGVALSRNLFHTAMRPGVSCYRIPALVTAVDGTLIAAMDERVLTCGDLHRNRDVNIVLRRSTDNGDTWSDIETVVNYPVGQAASDASMIVDQQTGDVFLFCNFMDLDEAPGVYRLHVLKSSDNGLSWGEPRDITAEITESSWQRDFRFITSGRGIQTRSGMLLHTLVNVERGLHVFGSRDHGRSWFLLRAALEPGDESKIVERADGTWLVNSRVRDAGMRYVHTSADEGQSWTTRAEPSLIDPACNASCIRYTSVADGDSRNRLLFSNAASSGQRENMTVRVSYDEGQTWTSGRTVYPGSAAYSSLTVLNNGDIGLLFEKDDHTENVFVRFSLEWLTEGEDKYTGRSSLLSD